RICDAKFGNIYRWDGQVFHTLATHNTPAAFAEARKRSPQAPPHPKSMFGRIAATKSVIHFADTLERRSHRELQGLGEVSQAVNSTLDLEAVLSTIVAKAVQLSGTEAGAIYVFDDHQGEFHLRATYGMDQELIDALTQRRIGLDDPNVVQALAQSEP